MFSKQGLGKEERLCSKKAIDALFTNTDSHSLSAYPIRAVYRYTEEAGIRILVSVSKKRFKHAVDRNRVKRQLREAYRLNKYILKTLEPKNNGIDIAFLWLTDKHHESKVVHAKITSILNKIAQHNSSL
ncbi:MAG: ribonuclease P protein component [Bacteroidaceae bacterium]|jgi:ribonuclease P protein component|nr:ribonuclease P protein component [Bacteroidaceae bacterium]